MTTPSSSVTVLLCRPEFSVERTTHEASVDLRFFLGVCPLLSAEKKDFDSLFGRHGGAAPSLLAGLSVISDLWGGWLPRNEDRRAKS